MKIESNLTSENIGQFLERLGEALYEFSIDNSKLKAGDSVATLNRTTSNSEINAHSVSISNNRGNN